MNKHFFSRIGLLTIVLLISGCGQKGESVTGEEKNKVKEAIDQAVTRELKIYQRAKQSVGKIERQAQERREKELKQ
ncbi:MAG: hypothetical protein IH857_08240 [Deltaproteobacteria bacterium]|nr:hypothetical protein [Deltaproteobacteria bacterium]